ncbi:unnamed protein product [Cuscuta europaea]|uniref:CRIB domain-containing protein n=1 Tax=Cuscuta europaea TaxID=41803 RepID=A0A9P0YSH3_CUSEU|nr:unnamed protein product [Cuscuta europaea]
MSTKVKGLIKGLRYISQIFDEEKEAEIQIGFPTDVKHVAHIGWDGPSAVDNPTWMNEFKGAGALKSAPLGPPVDSKENPEIKWVSEGSFISHVLSRLEFVFFKKKKHSFILFLRFKGKTWKIGKQRRGGR